MRRTRISLFYVIGYLIPGGLGLLVAPQLALKLLLSGGTYGDVMPQMVGMMMVALGLFVFQIVRKKAEGLYLTALAVRSAMLPVLLSLYVASRDPLFITLLLIVGFGVVYTGMSYRLDLRDRRSTLG
ncbi:MAG: hypothetical protein NTV05_01115 [Acidobacteria bacterium]|nr:hypothetical protein [Acidobacteriota bacterium]